MTDRLKNNDMITRLRGVENDGAARFAVDIMAFQRILA